ncbi:Protein pangolin, isoforms A/H/I [Papilio machaon]|uniref:Protein pangolin, isoforms A/H/I n=1 Tax=Papilio machaon TaxID=76193 RepID=A0A0N1IJI9_PAPMA|nr:Protein pangolin, isoforms A/H/I [Papilio machaon]
MPHAHSSSAASSGGDDLGSTDEVKVFKDEGDGEDEKRSSENLLEEKSSLIDWTESECWFSTYPNYIDIPDPKMAFVL